MSPLRILVVDDEEELVFTLAERLQFRGFDAVGVSSGAEAIKASDAGEFDVVVLDVKMPGMSGLETMQAIKRSRPVTRIILMTGHGSLQDGEEGLALGAFDYLVKPVNIDMLVAKINAAMGTAG
jgi:DNA-binding response OmpR family regulator